ncbi:MAG TPA: hypothetical protein VHR66_07285 [Gemmataceae bacterium]|jgi:uncharacterized delta-60 repeat protein|nr:hypothetical protein [Gemmataceae bacterium]
MPRRALLKLESLSERITPAAGQLDSLFGPGGIALTSMGPGRDEARSVKVDASGRYVVGGWAFNGTNYDFALSRYDSNGALDTSFGSGGKVITAIGSGDDFIQAIALDQSGQIVAAGYSMTGGNADFALARYNTDGSPDTSFGSGGKIVTPIGAFDDMAYAIAIDSVQRIVVGGSSSDGSVNHFGIARYTPSGALDSSFGSGGKVTTVLESFDDEIYDVAIDSSDRIVAVGTSNRGPVWDFAVARYDVNGSLDPTFDGDGVALTPIGLYAYAYGVAIDDVGRIVVGGHSFDNSNNNMALARYLPNGTLDSTFDDDGYLTVSSGPNSYIHTITIDSSGRIIAAGNENTGGHLSGNQVVGGQWYTTVERFNSNGTLDASFDGDGKVVTQTGVGQLALTRNVAIDAQGRVIVAGFASNGTNDDFFIARYLGEPFSVVATNSSMSFVEDSPSLTVDAGLDFSDSPNANLVGATVSIGNYVRSEDVLSFTPQGGISANFDNVAGVLTLSGSAPLANYQAELRSLTYTNTSQSPTELDRTITITVDDGEATQNLASASYTIHVVAVNDAPSFTADGVLFAILQANTTSLGQEIAGLFAGHFADPDSGSSLSGIAVVGNTANAVSEGGWQYSSDNGTTWFDIGAVADDATALALAASTRIRFVLVLSFTGEPTPLSVRAMDDTFAGAFTSGAARQTVDVTINGGSTPIAGTITPIRTTVFPIGTTGNNAPVLSGVPVSANIDEGQSLSFTANGFDPDLAPVLTFSLDSAPATATIDPDTGAFSWLTTEADGPDTFIFNVQVSDGLATTTKTITVLVREVNTAPTLANVPATANIVRGDTLSFTATATDSDILNGNGNALTFSLVGAPAGASIDPDTGDFTWTPTEAIASGDHTFTVRVVDDGVPAKNDTQSITVTLSNSLLDNGDLLIGGTTGNDTVTVNPAHDPTKVTVKLNGVKLGDFDLAAITGSIIVRTGAGADKVTISSKITKPALLDGGPGNDALTGGAGDDTILGGGGDDKLTGGKGNNVMVGGDGNDTLAGGAGRDVLIGSKGKDKLLGGSGDDLLIAGFTDFDTDVSALNDIFVEWNSGADYPTRIAHLTSGSGANGTTYLTISTVHDDGIKDVLVGAAGTDWFFVSALDTLDLKMGEQKVTV